MLTLLLAAALATSSQGKQGNPVVVPIKFFYGDPIIALSIDGKPPEEFGLTMTTRHSIVIDKVNVGDRRLSFDGKSLGAVTLESPGLNVHPVLNALGLTVLNGMAVGVDYARNEITFWPGGHLTPEAASDWILKAPKWAADSKVLTVPIQRKADVAPVITATIAGKKYPLLLRIGQQGSSFARGEEPPSGTPVEYGPGGNHALLTNVGIGTAVLPWTLYFRGVGFLPAELKEEGTIRAGIPPLPVRSSPTSPSVGRGLRSL